MDKPMTMIIEETKQNIIKVVNESKLPPFILEIIFKNLYTEIVSAAKQQIEYDKSEYKKSLQQEQSKTVGSAE